MNDRPPPTPPLPGFEPLLARVVRSDCLRALPRLHSESVDLIYADPPFDSGMVHRAQRGAGGEFDDRWVDAAAYLAFMRARLGECHRVLKPTGSLLLHCDWRHSHRLRCVLDELFGPERFVNHLVWSYGLGGSSPRRFARKHDDILFYAKGADYCFEPPRVSATSNRMKGQLKKATDVLDIPSINNMAHERTGWPTQKPLALLRVLVAACSPPGGLVLDPFCGSGTTLVAASELGRSSLGFDLSRDAVRLARARLAESSKVASSA